MWFIITCRPSFALLRGPFIIEFRAEFSSIEGTFNNHEPTLGQGEGGNDLNTASFKYVTSRLWTMKKFPSFLQRWSRLRTSTPYSHSRKPGADSAGRRMHRPGVATAWLCC